MLRSELSQDPHPPLIFGEVLFDCFPDGSRVLGGAAFNVAWHLKGFGIEPLFISRVGDDADGESVLARMVEWGMETAFVQRDPDHPTGRVQIALQDGQPTFTILEDQAYDWIDAHELTGVLRKHHPTVLYHGSLAARAQASRDALQVLRGMSGVSSFIDVNLRAPWWSIEIVQALLKGSRWAKLNDDELRTVSRRAVGKELPLEEAAHLLYRDYGLELLLVTRGADGAVAIIGEKIFRGPVAPVENLVDTVGAGDAFSAVCLMGLLLEWPFDQCLARALEFASAICGIRGATIADPNLYNRFQRRWQS